MTLLKQFLKKKGITITKMAKDIGYSRPYLTTVVNGAPGGKRLAQIIEDWSDCEVLHDSILYPNLYPNNYQYDSKKQ